MNCPYCQQDNPKEANFCRNCGRLLVPDCPRCQTRIIQPANFCHHCGLPLSPQSQAGWWPIHATGQTTVDRPAAIAEPAERDSQPESAAATHTPAIDRFIPRELARKLEAARASGSMVGERRVLTMLFCDVQGSTAAAEKLDPEEWTEIINGAFEHMIKPVYKYEGTVARLMGDAILAFFGAPIAHEDDPQRAVLAGLEIIEGIRNYQEKIQAQYGLDITARVGINTGLVVVGAVGSDLRMEYTAMGDAINLAARMEQTAEPGTVQIAEPTYQRVNHFFETEELGAVDVKGKKEAVLAYRVLERKAIEQSLRGIEGMRSPFVGRDAELKTLQDIMDKTSQGLGHIICLTGEAGLGKSRLVAEAHQYWQDKLSGAGWHAVSSYSYEKNNAFGLFQRLIQRLYQIAVSDSPTMLREKLEPSLAAFAPERRARVMQIFESFFSIDSGEGLPRLEGEAFKQEFFAVMRQLWQAQFAGRPAVLVFDDLHWSDPASIQLLTHLFEVTDTNPLILLCVFRLHEDTPAVALQRTAREQFVHRYTEIKLAKLAQAEINAILDGLLAAPDLPPALRQEILERAGGNPFFIEEVVRSLISRGVVVSREEQVNGALRQVWQVVDGASTMEIPDNLRGLLAARLDRLEEDTRATLQLASVIGRSFYERVLTQIAEQTNGANQFTSQHLRQLLRMQIIDEAARIPEIEYIFRNPLFQEVAYKGILFKRRRVFHKRVARVMETLYAQQRAQMAPRLAYHYQEAGMLKHAFDCYTLSGDQALHLYALQEALVQYNRALALLDDVQPEAEQLIGLYVNRGRVLEHEGHFAEALTNYEELDRLGQKQENKHIQLQALVARLTVHSMHSGVYDYDLAQKLAAEGLQMARRLGDKAAESRIEWNLMQMARSRGQEGDEQSSIRHGERSLKLARELDLRAQMALTLSNLAAIYRFAHQREKADASAEEARSLFREQGNLAMLADNYAQTSHFLGLMGKFDAAEEMAKEAQKISSQIGNLWNLGVSAATLGIVALERGHFAAAQEILETTLNLPDMSRFNFVQAVLNMRMVEIYLAAGDLDRADAMGEQALENAAYAPYVLATASALSHLVKLRKDPEGAQGFKLDLETQPDYDSVLRAFFNIFQLHYRLELAVAQQKANIAVRLANEALAVCERFDMHTYWPLFQRLLAESHWLRGDRPAALDNLAKAEAKARGIGSRRSLWLILARQARWAEDEETAEQYRLEAQKIIAYIVEHAGSEELQSSFLNRPDVRELMDQENRHLAALDLSQ
ncbi:MAG: adenylate/guanylate cyclase domain-containing protein [Candidatus Promineifilaceae bacterium]|nr:adenylate/guanylate cyclase domain-containing protein [Candidatus Promineifilaceae bacterium]